MKCAHSFRQWVEGDLHLPGVQAPDEQSAVVTCGGHQRTGLWVERQHTGLLLVTWGRSEGGGESTGGNTPSRTPLGYY